MTSVGAADSDSSVKHGKRRAGKAGDLMQQFQFRCAEWHCRCPAEHRPVRDGTNEVLLYDTGAEACQPIAADMHVLGIREAEAQRLNDPSGISAPQPCAPRNDRVRSRLG